MVHTQCTMYFHSHFDFLTDCGENRGPIKRGVSVVTRRCSHKSLHSGAQPRGWGLRGLKHPLSSGVVLMKRSNSKFVPMALGVILVKCSNSRKVPPPPPFPILAMPLTLIKSKKIFQIVVGFYHALWSSIQVYVGVNILERSQAVRWLDNVGNVSQAACISLITEQNTFDNNTTHSLKGNCTAWQSTTIFCWKTFLPLSHKTVAKKPGEYVYGKVLCKIRPLRLNAYKYTQAALEYYGSCGL